MRKSKLLNIINSYIYNFKLLHKYYTTKNEHNNFIIKKYENKELPLYLNEIEKYQYKKPPHYITPVLKLKKKLYYYDEKKEDEETIDNSAFDYIKETNTITNSIEDIKAFIESEYNNEKLFFTPYSNDFYDKNKKPNRLKDNNINFIYYHNIQEDSNSLDFDIYTYNESAEEKYTQKSFVTDTITDYDNSLYIDGYLYKPYEYVDQSKIYSNYSGLLTKSLYNDKIDFITDYENVLSNENIKFIDNNSEVLFKDNLDKFNIYFNKLENYNKFADILSPDVSKIVNGLNLRNIYDFNEFLKLLELYKIYYRNIKILIIN